MAEIKNSESDMSTQQKAELDKEKRKEEKKEAKSGLSFLNQSGMNMMALHPMTKYSV